MERLYLNVLSECDLAYFVVFSTVYAGVNGVQPGAHPAFWFPTKTVRAGDQVVLYTGTGVPTEQRLPTGGTAHLFYWGWPQTLWINGSACAVLFDATTWQTSPFG